MNVPYKNHLTPNSQCEDFVPLWVEVFVNGVCLQAVVAEFHNTEGVTLACEGHTHTRAQTHIKFISRRLV